MDWFSKVSTVLKVPNDFAIFFFTYDFAADFNMQYPWGKIRTSAGSHNARSARPVSYNQCNRQTRQDCRNQRRNSFLIHNIPLNRPEREGWGWARNGSRRKGGLWLKAGNDEKGDEGIRSCNNAVAYWYFYKRIGFCISKYRDNQMAIFSIFDTCSANTQWQP